MNREQALRVLGATNCVRVDGLFPAEGARSHLFAEDDSHHTLCTPQREVTEVFVIAGSERPTCVKCRAKYDAAIEVINTEQAIANHEHAQAARRINGGRA